ncbi:MMPL family transporter [Rhodoferax sp.]|uniref:MMPL family transporter n=1 Tax=Rhodoferax sp. TaxID=50421 RepID=UPI00274F08F9|nr:MMPL family transporter [Rhodoferax sp.]
MTWRGRLLPVGLWLVALTVCLVVIAQTRFVADLSAFMPKLPNQRQQLLVEQLRDGIIARLIMIGIEGGTASERAKLSIALAEKLRAHPSFVGIQNGDAATQERDRVYFFNNRYLLSPAVSSQRFTSAGLQQSIGDSIDALAGNAGLLLKQLLPRDPTGETLQLLGQFTGSSQPHSVSGAWASRDEKRALLLAQTRIDGSDTEAQAQAIEAIRQSFNQIAGRSADTRLVLSGTSVMSVSARGTIEREVRRLAAMSIVLVVSLLLLVYRSGSLLVLGLLPVASGALVGIAAVSLGFGHVHGLTLGFGTTLIGEAVDYSIYLFVQRAGGENPGAFWRTIRLGVLTSCAGFAALLFSGFPGLSQLGLYSISGLIAAALVTRYVLPSLMPQHVALRDLTHIGAVLDRLVRGATRLRWLIAAVLIAASASILFHTGDVWNRQLSALSPISKADMKLDAELRSDLGAIDMRYMATFTAADQESALRGAEQTGAVLQSLIKDKVIGGFNSPAFVLPSLALQRSRQAAIPDSQQARTNLGQALAELPIKPDRLEGFLADLKAAQARQPLTRTDLNGTSAALLVDSLLVKRDKDYLVLMPLRPTGEGSMGDLIDLGQVTTTLNAKGLSNVTVIDILEETTAVFDSYLKEALILSGLGCLAIAALLLIALRSVPRTLRVVTPLVCAVLCVTAVLLAAGVQLNIMHLVGLLLVVAVGTNYALFFDVGAQPSNEADRRQTLTSLVVANLTTVASFGLLGFSNVPVLSAIGTTVGPGALLALVFSAIFARAQSNAGAR